MRYLITTTDGKEPFLTEWFWPENHFNKKVGMTVFDLYTEQYMNDGVNWMPISIDHL
jgi:hypothetical protein